MPKLFGQVSVRCLPQDTAAQHCHKCRSERSVIAERVKVTVYSCNFQELEYLLYESILHVDHLAIQSSSMEIYRNIAGDLPWGGEQQAVMPNVTSSRLHDASISAEGIEGICCTPHRGINARKLLAKSGRRLLWRPLHPFYSL